jgi:2-polyprenyl-6-methoxyphenol hydroxylase-like FAD-dependent oxidoreductase
MKVLIVGGGIGGLATALELERRGIEAHVFESVETVQPLGVGINLLPHAAKHLIQLGLYDALAASAIQTEDLGFYNKFGQLIWHEPRGRAAGYKVPQFSIHRGELQMILYRAVAARLPGRLHPGHHLKDFRQTADGRVVASFVDRRTGAPVAEVAGDVLIGADGIHSAVRKALYPGEGGPLWSGIMFWRGAIEAAPFLSGRSMVMVGYPAQKFIAYPMSEPHRRQGSALINWAVDLQVAHSGTFQPQDWNRRGRREDFLPLFDNWRFDWLDIPDLIRRTESVYEFPCVDREPLERWTFGRVTLLGDAAHPLRPMGSNAGAQAIRDAFAIAEALAGHKDIDAALAAYEDDRRPATSRLILSNRQQGPERVMALVEERAPQGFADLHAVITPEELQQVADDYKQLAGFDRDSVNSGIEAVGP